MRLSNILLIFFITLLGVGCEEKDPLQIQEGIHCLNLDCITSSNPNIIGGIVLESNLIAISQIKTEFKNQWSDDSYYIHIFEEAGYPAWDLAQGISG